MKKALAYIGISSSVVTILTNLFPDEAIGTKILLFIIFGLLVFGISWAKKNITKLLDGLVIGFVVGAGTGLCLGAIDNSLSKMSEFTGTINYNFLVSLKWILPIVVNTFWGSVPWRSDSNI